MAYRDANPGNFRYLVGKTIDRISDSTCDATGDAVHLDTEVMFLYHLASPITQDDAEFETAWRRIEAEEHDADEEAYETWHRERRFRQLGELVKSLHRRGIISKHETFHDEDADI